MKKVIVVIMLLASFTAFAQRGGHKGKKQQFAKDLTVEQIATLKTKKMTLALDLSKTQQKQIMDLTIVRLEERKAKMEERKEQSETSKPEKPSSEERFEMINSRLDKQLAHQEQMKQILNNEQYKLWKEISMKKHAQGKKRMQKEGRRG